jgi:hypothetical protein
MWIDLSAVPGKRSRSGCVVGKPEATLELPRKSALRQVRGAVGHPSEDELAAIPVFVNL